MRIVKGIGLLGNIIFQLFLIGCSIGANAQTTDTSDTSSTVDSLILTPTIGIKYAKVSSANNKLILDNVTRNPYISVQQYIKGNAAGTYIQEPTGEPGVAQNMFIHGLSAPLL
ncbi:MAG TPA: hypothetical protein VL943_13935, partial [Niabella sp.]|nr:hypothetical protein [Niabella sp.]